MQGTSNTVGEKGKVFRGPAAREKDFAPVKTLISDEDANQATIAHILNKKKPKMDPVLSGLDEHQVEEKVDGIK